MQAALLHLRNADPVLAAIIERVGAFRMSYREPEFASLARSIVFQQLNGRAALTIWNRLEERTGAPVTPQGVLKLRMPTLRKIGLSRQKAGYLRDLARRALGGEIRFESLAALADPDVIAALTTVKGIGVWTAQMFLMFALRRPNVLPTGDYGIRLAMQRAYRMRVLPGPAPMQKLAKSWHPYCSIACWYLWRSLDQPAQQPVPLPIEI
ncbi:MAG: DNA-3-methyladenine glycosylase 2 family protein [Acidobacteria bacterium]|nr:DNA-3-methyladenine glycosylase 2 family protein [Acidobacteriota bacterium]